MLLAVIGGAGEGAFCLPWLERWERFSPANALAQMQSDALSTLPARPGDTRPPTTPGREHSLVAPGSIVSRVSPTCGISCSGIVVSSGHQFLLGKGALVHLNPLIGP